jgi:OmpA-OmpF porin, OOP family
MLRKILLALALLSAPAAAQSKPVFKLNGNTLEVPGPVLYEVNSAKLKAESAPVLDHVKAYLDEKTYISMLRIEVHADSMGDDQANQKMSEQRALATAQALVKLGVDCKRLIPVGFGETKPIADNSTAEGRAQNRRTEFVNAALRGRPIGGMPVDGGGMVAGDPCKVK